jgi:site-specific DNA-methyltransferase (adenine-specific)
MKTLEVETDAMARFSASDCSLILGDCREVLRGTGPWDMVLTSPPYNAKKPYDGYLDDVPEDEYWSMIRDVAALTWNECRAGAYALWNVPLWWGKRPKKYRPDKYREAITAAGWEFRDEIMWAKGTTAENAHAGGYAMNHPHTPSIRNPYEPVLVFLKPGQPKAKPDWTVERWAKETIGLWCIQPERVNHPCPFPSSLAEKAVRLYSAPGETVCDPFAGSGTVGVAAKRTGRAFIGAEISPRHHEDAAMRIHSANVPALAQSGGEKTSTKESNSCRQAMTFFKSIFTDKLAAMRAAAPRANLRMLHESNGFSLFLDEAATARKASQLGTLTDYAEDVLEDSVPKLFIPLEHAMKFVEEATATHSVAFVDVVLATRINAARHTMYAYFPKRVKAPESKKPSDDFWG